MKKSARVLIVDDNIANCKVLEALIQTLGHIPIITHDGLSALCHIRKNPVDMVLLDIHMPIMNGFEVLETLKKDTWLRHVPIIIISANDGSESIVKCIENGADDYLVKPFNFILLKARINSCLLKKYLHDQEEAHRRFIENSNDDLERRVGKQMQEILDAQWTTIFAMAKLSESRDPETGGHLTRIQGYCRALSERLRLSPEYASVIDDAFLENIYHAASLHDIGKVGIPDDILLKKGELTIEEFNIMKTHTILGANTLREVEQKSPGNSFVRMGIEIAECHHEKWDGTGYPYGIAGKNIPLSARIVALSDVFDALTTKRTYKKSFTFKNSHEIILKGSGKLFDPDVVKAFLSLEEFFFENAMKEWRLHTPEMQIKDGPSCN